MVVFRTSFLAALQVTVLPMTMTPSTIRRRILFQTTIPSPLPPPKSIAVSRRSSVLMSLHEHNNASSFNEEKQCAPQPRRNRLHPTRKRGSALALQRHCIVNQARGAEEIVQQARGAMGKL